MNRSRRVWISAAWATTRPFWTALRLARLIAQNAHHQTDTDLLDRHASLIPRALAIQADTPDSVDLAFGSMSRATGEFRGKSRRQRGADKDRFFGDIKEAEEALRRKKNK